MVLYGLEEGEGEEVVEGAEGLGEVEEVEVWGDCLLVGCHLFARQAEILPHQQRAHQHLLQ